VKWLFRAILLAIIASPFLIVFAMIEPEALVPAGESVNVDDVGRIKAILEKNDPRDLREGERRDIELTARDINLALAYGLSRLPVPQSLRAYAVLGDGHGDLMMTMPLEGLPLSGFVNARARLLPAERGVTVDAIHVGRLPVPRVAWQWVVDQVRPQLDSLDGYWELRDLLNAASNVRFAPDALGMTMTWQGDLARRIEEKGRALLLPAADRDRIVDYLNALAVETGGATGSVSLATLLGPVFAHAQGRSADGGDGIAENRAALVALALYVAADNDDLRRVLGDQAAGAVKRLSHLDVRLRERHDLAQHFLVSAALSAASNSALADVIGVFKEEQDSLGGSGFSFADLAADRAGIRFAEAAIADPAGWQSRARAVTVEEEFMPAVDALPEGMQAPDFAARFEDRDSDAYAQVIAEIDGRLARCALYQ
jgi:hypothetical protein